MAVEKTKTDNILAELRKIRSSLDKLLQYETGQNSYMKGIMEEMRLRQQDIQEKNAQADERKARADRAYWAEYNRKVDLPPEPKPS